MRRSRRASRPSACSSGPRMNLGDVAKKTVPKMCLVSPARHGGAIDTRTFIPHRVHEAIGVFGAVSVATACVTPGSVAAQVARRYADVAAAEPRDRASDRILHRGDGRDGDGSSVTVNRSALLRTARKLMHGEVFVPASVWSGP